MYRKILSLVCAMSFVLSTCTNVFAKRAEETSGWMPMGGAKIEVEYFEIEDDPGDREMNLFSSGAEATEEEVYNFLVNAIDKRNLTDLSYGGKIYKVVDVSSLNIPSAKRDEVLDIAGRVFYSHPELLISNSQQIFTSETKVMYLEFTYLFDEQTEKTKKSEIKKVIDDYANLAASVPEATGKILVVHDAIAKDCRYATAELDAILQNGGARDESENIIYTGYGALINKVAVCQGYAIALGAVLSKLGIDNVFCVSDELNHIWNKVKLDGKWYNIDITWDDSDIKDSDGNLRKGAFWKWFLITDEKNAEDHGAVSNWEISGAEKHTPCTDTKYQSGHIFNGGNLYGTITYENGKYKIALVNYPENPFFSNSVKSPGIIASEAFAYDGINYVCILANDNVGDVDAVEVTYSGGKLSDVGIAGKYTFGAGNIRYIDFDISADKIMLWKSGTQQPVCESR